MSAVMRLPETMRTCWVALLRDFWPVRPQWIKRPGWPRWAQIRAKSATCCGLIVLRYRFVWTRYHTPRSEENTSELQSLMLISYAVLCLKKQNTLNKSIKAETIHII